MKNISFILAIIGSLLTFYCVWVDEIIMCILSMICTLLSLEVYANYINKGE